MLKLKNLLNQWYGFWLKTPRRINAVESMASVAWLILLFFFLVSAFNKESNRLLTHRSKPESSITTLDAKVWIPVWEHGKEKALKPMETWTANPWSRWVPCKTPILQYSWCPKPIKNDGFLGLITTAEFMHQPLDDRWEEAQKTDRVMELERPEPLNSRDEAVTHVIVLGPGASMNASAKTYYRELLYKMAPYASSGHLKPQSWRVAALEYPGYGYLYDHPQSQEIDAIKMQMRKFVQEIRKKFPRAQMVFVGECFGGRVITSDFQALGVEKIIDLMPFDSLENLSSMYKFMPLRPFVIPGLDTVKSFRQALDHGVPLPKTLSLLAEKDYLIPSEVTQPVLDVENQEEKPEKHKVMLVQGGRHGDLFAFMTAQQKKEVADFLIK